MNVHYKELQLFLSSIRCTFSASTYTPYSLVKHQSFILFLIAILLAGTGTVLNAQDKEYAFGINVNSKSYFIGGVDFSIKQNHSSSLWKSMMLFEAVNIKHPNEVRFSTGFASNNILGNKPFVLGKSNFLFALRSDYGFEKNWFRPDEKSGVNVDFQLLSGLTIGLEKPYFIKYRYSSELIETEQYDANTHVDYGSILGAAGVFKGFERTKIVPGLNLRCSLNFEYGMYKKYKTIIETGFTLEQYMRRITIIDEASPKSFYGTVFLVFYIAKN